MKISELPRDYKGDLLDIEIDPTIPLRNDDECCSPLTRSRFPLYECRGEKMRRFTHICVAVLAS